MVYYFIPLLLLSLCYFSVLVCSLFHIHIYFNLFHFEYYCPDVIIFQYALEPRSPGEGLSKRGGGKNVLKYVRITNKKQLFPKISI